MAASKAAVVILTYVEAFLGLRDLNCANCCGMSSCVHCVERSTGCFSYCREFPNCTERDEIH